MSYETDRDFTRFLQSFPAQGQRPGAAPQEIPFVIADRILPTTDALGWFRYGRESATEDVFVTNQTVVDLAIVPQGSLARLFWALSCRHEDGVTAQTLSFEKIVPGLAPTIGLTQVPFLDVPAFTGIALPKPVLVLPGERIRARAFPGTGVALVFRITGQFVDLPIGEAVAPF